MFDWANVDTSKVNNELFAQKARAELEMATADMEKAAEDDHKKRIEKAANDLMQAIRGNIEAFAFEYDNPDDFIRELKEDRKFAVDAMCDSMLGNKVIDNFIKYAEVICER